MIEINKKEYTWFLKKEDEIDPIYPYELIDKTPRTLLYGYTFERCTWHLYFNGKFFVLLISERDFENYETDKPLEYHKYVSLNPVDFCRYVKRLYPESCDFTFASFVKSRGMELPFTNFDEIRYEKVKDIVFHGRIMDIEYYRM